MLTGAQVFRYAFLAASADGRLDNRAKTSLEALRLRLGLSLPEAAQICREFAGSATPVLAIPESPAERRNILGMMIQIALANGAISPARQRVLDSVCASFAVSKPEYTLLVAQTAMKCAGPGARPASGPMAAQPGVKRMATPVPGRGASPPPAAARSALLRPKRAVVIAAAAVLAAGLGFAAWHSTPQRRALQALQAGKPLAAEEVEALLRNREELRTALASELAKGPPSADHPGLLVAATALLQDPDRAGIVRTVQLLGPVAPEFVADACASSDGRALGAIAEAANGIPGEYRTRMLRRLLTEAAGHHRLAEVANQIQTWTAPETRIAVNAGLRDLISRAEESDVEALGAICARYRGDAEFARTLIRVLEDPPAKHAISLLDLLGSAAEADAAVVDAAIAGWPPERVIGIAAPKELEKLGAAADGKRPWVTRLAARLALSQALEDLRAGRPLPAGAALRQALAAEGAWWRAELGRAAGLPALGAARAAALLADAGDRNGAAELLGAAQPRLQDDDIPAALSSSTGEGRLWLLPALAEKHPEPVGLWVAQSPQTLRDLPAEPGRALLMRILPRLPDPAVQSLFGNECGAKDPKSWILLAVLDRRPASASAWMKNNLAQVAQLGEAGSQCLAVFLAKADTSEVEKLLAASQAPSRDLLDSALEKRPQAVRNWLQKLPSEQARSIVDKELAAKTPRPGLIQAFLELRPREGARWLRENSAAPALAGDLGRNCLKTLLAALDPRETESLLPPAPPVGDWLIQALLDGQKDTVVGWLRKQSDASLEHLSASLGTALWSNLRSAAHPEAELNGRLERVEVRADIARMKKLGNSDSLPGIEQTGKEIRAGISLYEIDNQTGFALTLCFEGPEARKVPLAKGGKQKLELKSGTYALYATVDCPEVKLYCGTRDLRGQYRSKFTVHTEIAGGPPPAGSGTGRGGSDATGGAASGAAGSGTGRGGSNATGGGASGAAGSGSASSTDSEAMFACEQFDLRVGSVELLERLSASSAQRWEIAAKPAETLVIVSARVTPRRSAPLTGLSGLDGVQGYRLTADMFVLAPAAGTPSRPEALSASGWREDVPAQEILLLTDDSLELRFAFRVSKVLATRLQFAAFGQPLTKIAGPKR